MSATASVEQLEGQLSDPDLRTRLHALRELKHLADSGKVKVETPKPWVNMHLHTFFSRYYDQGDFISQRRYKADTYAIPYEVFEIADYQAGADALVTLVGKLYERGIPIVPGTDHIAGFTLHRELELYSEAGIPNMSVLGIATLQSANLVGAAYRSGSIAVGKDADVLLIDGDPTRNMSDIRKVALVVKGRNYFKPAELYTVLGVKPFVAAATPARR